MSQLLETLTTRQKESRLSDREFAARLGVHRVTWVQIRNGRRPVNLAFLRSVLRAFPDMDEQVLDFLKKGKSRD